MRLLADVWRLLAEVRRLLGDFDFLPCPAAGELDARRSRDWADFLESALLLRCDVVLVTRSRDGDLLLLRCSIFCSKTVLQTPQMFTNLLKLL